jgi:hypothetical protein
MSHIREPHNYILLVNARNNQRGPGWAESMYKRPQPAVVSTRPRQMLSRLSSAGAHPRCTKSPAPRCPVFPFTPLTLWPFTPVLSTGRWRPYSAGLPRGSNL